VSGRLVPADEATIGVLDHGFTVGDGVFETLRTLVDPAVGVVPFAMDRHIARLQASASGLGIEAPDADEVRDALLAVCAANPELADRGGRVRVTLTSGAGPLGSDRAGASHTLAVAVAPATTWPRATTLAISPWPRNERSPLVGLKSTSYAENVFVLAWAKARGAGEAVLGNLSGDLCEGTGSNVFVVRGGVVSTPSLGSGCLAGITRGLVLEWCGVTDHPVDQMDSPLAALVEADEVFITSSTRDVHPVERVLDADGAPVWQRGPGPVTARIAAIFAERAAQDWNP
jgi:branched-chain amino acid aminotransferase